MERMMQQKKIGGCMVKKKVVRLAEMKHDRISHFSHPLETE